MFFIPFALWIVFWFWLLLDCLRRDRFPPIFGHGRANRVVWLLLLATLDPLLSLFYFFMVKLWWGRDSGWTRWGVGMGAALVILGWVDLGFGTAPGDMKRESDGKWQGQSTLVDVRAIADLHQSRADSSSAQSGSRGALLPARDIEVLMSDGGVVTAGLAQLLAAELAQLPFVRRIDVRKQGETREGGRAPDLRIRVTGADVGWLFPFRASPSSVAPLFARVGIHIPGWRSSGSFMSSSVAPVMRTHGTLQATVGSAHLGLASPTARCRGAADHATAYVRGFVADLRRAFAENRPIVSLPDGFYGIYRKPPEFPFLDRVDATVTVAESDILVDGKTVWQFVMPGWDEYERIREEFAAAGYESNVSGWSEASPNTDLINGNRWVSISASDEYLAESSTRGDGGEWEHHRPEVAGVRFHVHFEERFSEERMKRLLREAIAAGRLDIAMAMSGKIPKEDVPGLLKALVDYPVMNPFETLVRARIAKHAGDQEAVSHWVRRAVALSPVAMGHPLKQKYETDLSDLVTEIGIDPAEVKPKTRPELAAAGFTDLDAGPVRGDLQVGSMLWFFYGDDSQPLRGAVLIVEDEAGERRIKVHTDSTSWLMEVPEGVGMAVERRMGLSGAWLDVWAERGVDGRIKTSVTLTRR